MINLTIFLKSNLKDFPIKIGSSLEELKNIYGEPTERWGNDDVGWLYYKDIRFVHVEGIISEIGIELPKCKGKYKLLGDNRKASGVVSSKTRIIELLSIFALSGIKYKFLNTLDNANYISLVTEGNVSIATYIEWDEISLINYTGILNYAEIPIVV